MLVLFFYYLLCIYVVIVYLYRTLRNIYQITEESIELGKGLTWNKRGFVIKSSDYVWQKDYNNAINVKMVKPFLLALLGVPPKNLEDAFLLNEQM